MQTDGVLTSTDVNPSMAHVCTGLVTDALPPQAQLGLQQSQYRVVTPFRRVLLLEDTVVDDEVEDPDIGRH